MSLYRSHIAVHNVGSGSRFVGILFVFVVLQTTTATSIDLIQPSFTVEVDSLTTVSHDVTQNSQLVHTTLSIEYTDQQTQESTVMFSVMRSDFPDEGLATKSHNFTTLQNVMSSHTPLHTVASTGRTIDSVGPSGQPATMSYYDDLSSPLTLLSSINTVVHSSTHDAPGDKIDSTTLNTQTSPPTLPSYSPDAAEDIPKTTFFVSQRSSQSSHYIPESIDAIALSSSLPTTFSGILSESPTGHKVGPSLYTPVYGQSPDYGQSLSSESDNSWTKEMTTMTDVTLTQTLLPALVSQSNQSLPPHDATPMSMSPLDTGHAHDATPMSMLPLDTGHAHDATPMSMSPLDTSHAHDATSMSMSPLDTGRAHDATPMSMSPLDTGRAHDATPMSMSPLDTGRAHDATPMSMSPLDTSRAENLMATLSNIGVDSDIYSPSSRSEIPMEFSDMYNSRDTWISTGITTTKTWSSSNEHSEQALSSPQIASSISNEPSMSFSHVYTEVPDSTEAIFPSSIDTVYSTLSLSPQSLSLVAPTSLSATSGYVSFYSENTESLVINSDLIWVPSSPTSSQSSSSPPPFSDNGVATEYVLSSFPTMSNPTSISNDGVNTAMVTNSLPVNTDSSETENLSQSDASFLLTSSLLPTLFFNLTSAEPIDSSHSDIIITDFIVPSTTVMVSLAMSSSTNTSETSTSKIPRVTTEPSPPNVEKYIFIKFTLKGECTLLEDIPDGIQQLSAASKHVLETIINQTILEGDIVFQSLKCHPFSLSVRLDKKFSKITKAVNTTLDILKSELNITVVTANGDKMTIKIIDIQTIDIAAMYEAGSYSIVDTIVISLAACICCALVALGIIVFIRELCCKYGFIALHFRKRKRGESGGGVSLTGLSINSEMKDNGSEVHRSPSDDVYSTITHEKETTTSFMKNSDIRRSSGKTGKNRRSLTKRAKPNQNGQSYPNQGNGTAGGNRPYGFVIGLMGYKPDDIYAVPKKPAKKVYGLAIRSTGSLVRTSSDDNAENPNQPPGEPVPPRRYLKRYLKKGDVTDSSENLVPSQRKVKSDGDPKNGVDNPSFVDEATKGVYDSKSSLII